MVATYIPTKWILAQFSLSSGKTINLVTDTITIVALKAGSGVPNTTAGGIQFLSDVFVSNPEDTLIGARQVVTGQSLTAPSSTSYSVNFKFNNITYNQNASDDGLTRYFALVDSTVGTTDAARPVLAIIDPGQLVSVTQNPVILSLPSNGLITFATGAPTTTYVPEAPEGLAAVVSTNSVALSWSANSLNDSVTGYNVYREPQGSTTSVLLGTVTTLTYTDKSSSLTSGSTWTYYITATNVIGQSASSNTVNVTMPVLAVPSAPTGLTALANSNDTVSLNWNANSAGDNVTGYHLYREPQGGTSAVLVTTTTSLTYLDSSVSLIAGSSWTYYLTATNANGTSANSSSVNVSIPGSTGSARFIAPFQVTNYSNTTIPSGSQITFAQPFAPSDIPGNSSIQIRAANGTTIIGNVQQDQESLWVQDGSYKTAAISMVSPDTFQPTVLISSITWAANVTTVTTATNHGLASGSLVSIQNAVQDFFNGVQTVTSVPSATQFTFTLNPISVTATANSGQQFLTAVNSIVGLNSYGYIVSGTGIPAGTLSYQASGSATNYTILLTQNANATSTGTYTFTPPATGGTSVSTATGTANATASQVIQYQIWENPVAKSQTANVTLSQITTNSDIKLLFTGYDLGTDTWEVSVNDIVANGNGAAWAPTSGAGWGANPAHGWEIIRSGPVCTEWRLWSVLKRLSDSALHPWMRGIIYLRCWGMNGTTPILEISGMWMQSNVYGANTSPIGIKTNNSTDFIIAAYRYITTKTTTAGNGWTLINSADGQLVEYQKTTTVQTSLLVSSGGSDPNGGLADAIMNGTPDPNAGWHSHLAASSGTSVSLPGISTTNSNNVIVVIVTENTGPVNSITSSSGLSFYNRAKFYTNETGSPKPPDFIEEWYAVAPNPLTNEIIKLNFSGASYVTADAFAISGVNTTSATTIFDGATDLPFNLLASSSTIEPMNQFNATLQDGATVLQYYGGPNDYRTAFTSGANAIPLNSSTVNTSNGQITLTLNQFNALLGVGATKVPDNGGTYGGGNGGRIPVVFSVSGGTLPGGLAPYDGTRNTVYWILGPYNHGYSPTQTTIQVATNANNAWSITPMSLSSTGSGTMTITPLAFTFNWACGLALDPTTVGRTWRNGTKPTLLIGHDFTYLTTKSRCIPPYVSTIVVANQVSSPIPWSQGCSYFPSVIGGYGDGDDDDRIGYLIQHNAQELYRPFDRNLHQLNLAIAASWMECGGYQLVDETTGLTAIPFNSPATNYPYLSAPKPAGGGNGNTYTIQLSGNAYDNAGGSSPPARDHSPCPEILPYLKTGDFLYIDSLLMAHQYSISNVYNGYVDLPGYSRFYRPWAFNYYDGNGYTTDAIFGKGRGQAWCCRTMGFGLHFFPSARPELPYFHDMMTDASNILMALVNTGTQTGYVPSGMQTLGVWCGITPDGNNLPASLGFVGPPVDTEKWMDDWQFASFAVMAWRAEYTGFLSWLQNYFYKGIIGRVDETPAVTGQTPGFIWAANMSQTTYMVGKVNSFDTWAQTWDDVYTWTGWIQPGGGLPNGSAICNVTQGSNTITNIDSADLGDISGFINFQGGGYWVNTIPNFDFPVYTVTNILNTTNATLTVQAYPNTIASTQAVSSRSETSTTAMFSRVPIPWSGIANFKSAYPNVFNNQINLGTPGDDYPDSQNGYLCYLTWAVAMCDILYNQNGSNIPAFQNARAIYNEIRRRQGQGSSPFDPNPLTTRNYPKYVIGYIGSLT
jgi:hypothetical protein